MQPIILWISDRAQEEMVEKLSQQELLRTLWRARTPLQAHICQEELRYLYRQNAESLLAGLR